MPCAARPPSGAHRVDGGAHRPGAVVRAVESTGWSAPGAVPDIAVSTAPPRPPDAARRVGSTRWSPPVCGPLGSGHHSQALEWRTRDSARASRRAAALPIRFCRDRGRRDCPAARWRFPAGWGVRRNATATARRPAGGELARAAREAGAVAAHTQAGSKGSGFFKKISKPCRSKICKGDPVDVATGDMVLQHTDLSLPGVLPLTLTRTQLSGYRWGHWFGRSWASTLDERIEVGPDGVGAVWAREEGSLVTGLR
ncbi:hypothetical protein BCL76_11561 [Streptomyces sp. CG 926]|nr:hypothetical protein BCL76_11561 [Streptomyces sp. CG 926]